MGAEKYEIINRTICLTNQKVKKEKTQIIGNSYRGKCMNLSFILFFFGGGGGGGLFLGWF
jgi:hypothetical protein